MKNFIDLLLEEETEDEIRKRMKLDPKEYNFYYKGKWIIDTLHKLERESQRGKESTDLFKKAIDWLIDNKKGSKEYLFVSKSTRYGMVIDYRKDKNGRVPGNNLVVVTWLGDTRKPPISKPNVKDIFVKKGTDKVIVECIDFNLTFNEFVELE